MEMNGKIGYVINVHTLKTCRNRGIGSRLLETVRAWAEREGFELLFVWLGERSVSYYARQGFTRDNDLMECLTDRGAP